MRQRAGRTVQAGFLSVSFLFYSASPALALRIPNPKDSSTLEQELAAGLEEGSAESEKLAARSVEHWQGEVRRIVESSQPGKERALANLWVRLHKETRGDRLHERLDQAVVETIPAAFFPDVAARLRVIRRMLLPDFIAHGLRLPNVDLPVEPSLEIVVARQIARLAGGRLERALLGEEAIAAELSPDWIERLEELLFREDLTWERFFGSHMEAAGYAYRQAVGASTLKAGEFTLAFEVVPGLVPPKDTWWSSARRTADYRVRISFVPLLRGRSPVRPPPARRATGDGQAEAGLEEAVFPEPVETDRRLADEVWEDGGSVYPSGRDRLGTVAFVSPSDRKGGVGIYASLWKLDHERMIPELFNLPEIPRVGTVYLYDETGRVPPETRKRVMEILKEQGVQVVARISANENRWEVPMIPIDAGGGQIRFEGWVPAKAEFVGDHKVVVEVRWRWQWHRLSEKGWFRIHPLEPNGLKLRIPAAQKHKLWVSPTGQPVVIGWTPQRTLDLSTDPRVPIAGQPYWIRFRDGRSYLLSKEQMDQLGFSYSPDRPDLRKGEPIVEAAIDVDPAGGIVEVPSSQLFEDLDETLGARLRKSFQVLGIRWRLEEHPAVSHAQAEDLVRSMAKRLEEIHTAGELRDLFVELEDGDGGWGRVASALSQISPAERDGFLRLIHSAFDQWARKSSPTDPAAPVVRVSREPGLRLFQTDEPGMAVFSLNGVRDLTLRKRKDRSGNPVEGTVIGGGGPLAVARAASNLREGARMMLVALGLGESGSRLFEGLQEDGFTEVPPDGVFQPIPGKEQESRVSVNGSVSSSPTVSTKQVQQAVILMVEKMSAHGPGGTLVIGEHLVRVSDSGDPHWVAKALGGLAREAGKLGWQTAVAASNSWDKKTYQLILETRPNTFHLDLEPFARLVDSSEEELLYRPREEVAELADQIRRLYGVERFIVSLKAAGEILVTPSGWFAAVPSPALELTYVTGERDVVLGVFLGLLQRGFSVKEALEQAVTAGVLHMEGWGRPVTENDIADNRHRASAHELLRPVTNLPLEPALETQRVGTEIKEGVAPSESLLPVVMGRDQAGKGWRRIVVHPAQGPSDSNQIIREILKPLSPGEAPAADLLIGPGALAGSAGVPALWPLLIELKAVLPEQEWRAAQRHLILHTEDQALSTVLKEAGYEVTSGLDSLKEMLSQRSGGELVFYMGQGDVRLRVEIPWVTQSVPLTPENYLSVLGRLLELVGFLRPEPLQLEGLPEALMEAA